MRTIGMVDCVILNDAEIRSSPTSRTSSRAARKVLDDGPARRRRQAGRVRRGDVHARRLLRPAGVPDRPTSSTRPAPATRSRAASWATSPRTRARSSTDDLLRTRDGLRHRAGLVQRRGVRHRADADARPARRSPPASTSCSASAPSRPRRSRCGLDARARSCAWAGGGVPHVVTERCSTWFNLAHLNGSRCVVLL